MTLTDLSLSKTIDVAAPPERAFATFTERIGEWWPMATHSICEDAAGTVAFRGDVLVETTPAGDEHVWADVLALEPPRRILLNWRVNPQRADTRVEVAFEPLARAQGEGTRVTLTHSGFDDPGRAAAYTAGWGPVLERFDGAL